MAEQMFKSLTKALKDFRKRAEEAEKRGKKVKGGNITFRKKSDNSIGALVRIRKKKKPSPRKNFGKSVVA